MKLLIITAIAFVLLIPTNVSAYLFDNPCEEIDKLVEDKEKIVKAHRDGGYVTWSGHNNKLQVLIEEQKQCLIDNKNFFASEPQELPHNADLDGFTPASEPNCGAGTILQGGMCIVDTSKQVSKKSSWFSWIFDLFQGIEFNFAEPTTVSEKPHANLQSEKFDDNAIFMTHQEQMDFLKEGEVLAPYVNPSNPYP